VIVFCPKCGSELITLIPPEEYFGKCKKCGATIIAKFDVGEIGEYTIWELKVKASWRYKKKQQVVSDGE